MIIKDFSILKGKTVKIETVMFCASGHSVYDEGVIEDIILEGNGTVFIVLDSGALVNCRYIRRMEIIE